MSDRLSLRQAREQGRLNEFAAQAEREHKAAKPISRERFDAILGAAVKSEKAKRRTSGSRARGGSNDTRTQRGT